MLDDVDERLTLAARALEYGLMLESQAAISVTAAQEGGR